jgi:hypothetical protein
MDSDNEMIQQIIEDKQEFDADRRGHMSITGCHKICLMTVEPKKKVLHHGGSKPGRKKSKPL